MSTPAIDLRPSAPAAPTRPLPWMAIAWFAVLLGLLYGSTLLSMGREWITDDDMGHGFFGPVVAAWIAWQKREEILGQPVKPSPWGLLLVVWGAIQLAIATLGAEMFLARTAFLISLVGVIWTIAGTAVLRALAFPLFLLIFMVRLPAIVYNQITFPLQLFASQVAETVLSAIGIPVLREGNVLELASQRLNVVEACSGIRSLLSLTFLSFVYAYFFESRLWIKVAIVVATIPIAILANAGRVTGTGILSEYKREWAEGFLHSVEGWAVFMIALMALILFHRLLVFATNLFEGRKAKP
jgi:exosortase